jgi:hypothetical protein
MLTVHLDAFALARSGAVTVRDCHGETHAIETFAWPFDLTLGAAAERLTLCAKEILESLPEQLALLFD